MVSHQATIIKLDLDYRFHQIIVWFLLQYTIPLPPHLPFKANRQGLQHPCRYSKDLALLPSYFRFSSCFQGAFTTPSHPALQYYLFHLFRFAVLFWLYLHRFTAPHFARRNCFCYLRYQKSHLFQFLSLITIVILLLWINQMDCSSWYHYQWTSFDC